MVPDDLDALWPAIREQLRRQGLGVESRVVGSGCADVKVVALCAKLADSVEEMGKAPRDQVVMVRLDRDTAETLDAWVETGALKSRSEAAALFIREGMEVRAEELAELRGAIADVRDAKQRLERAAARVLGAGPEEREEDDDDGS